MVKKNQRLILHIEITSFPPASPTAQCIYVTSQPILAIVYEKWASSIHHPTHGSWTALIFYFAIFCCFTEECHCHRHGRRACTDQNPWYGSSRNQNVIKTKNFPKPTNHKFLRQSPSFWYKTNNLFWDHQLRIWFLVCQKLLFFQKNIFLKYFFSVIVSLEYQKELTNLENSNWN